MRYLIFLKGFNMPKGVVLFFNAIIALLAPIKMMLYGLLFLIFVDLITGIRKHHHVHNFSLNPLKKDFWKAIKSNALRSTWVKTYEYGIGIIIAIVFENMVFGGDINISIQDKVFSMTKLAIIISSAIEMWSVFENMEAVSGRNILKRLINFLPQKVQDLFKNKNYDREED